MYDVIVRKTLFSSSFLMIARCPTFRHISMASSGILIHIYVINYMMFGMLRFVMTYIKIFSFPVTHIELIYKLLFSSGCLLLPFVKKPNN